MCSKFITIDLMGGLGNQMFQIAAAYGIACELGRQVVLKRNAFIGCLSGSHPSTYYNTFFDKINFVDNINPDIEIKERQYTYYDIVNELKQLEEYNCIKLHGYFQSDKYFKNILNDIKKLFTPNNSIKEYLKENSSMYKLYPELFDEHDYAVICVRRGDYLKFPHIHNPCGMTYFKAAISKMNKEIYYIISDDIKWAKENFIGDNYKFIDNCNDTFDFMSIMLFKNYIISNSSYHWWGSFLSLYENPRIIVPDKWVHSTVQEHWSIYRDNMEIIERPVEI